MSKLPSLLENPEMLDVLARYPQGITALFNLMNRLIEGTGITANPMARAASRERAAGNLANPAPYAQFGAMVERLHEERYGAGA